MPPFLFAMIAGLAVLAIMAGLMKLFRRAYGLILFFCICLILGSFVVGLWRGWIQL